MGRLQEIEYDLELIIAKLKSGKTKAQVAREIGLSKQTLCKHLEKLLRSGKIYHHKVPDVWEIVK